MTQNTGTGTAAAAALALAVAAVVALVIVAAAVLGALAVAVSPLGLAGLGGTGPGGGASVPSDAARTDIPTDYLDLYTRAAGDCPGLDWSVLAGIGKVETDHGRSPLPGVHSGENSAGAAGPMQFLASTFDTVLASHPLPPGGAVPPSRYNPHDAIHAAAFYLCDQGAPADLRGAVFAYCDDLRQVTDRPRRLTRFLLTGRSARAFWLICRRQGGLSPAHRGRGP